MYKLIATISMLIRQFVLPNPFEGLGEIFDVTLFDITLKLTPDILNWIVEPGLHLLAFGVAGIYYVRGLQDPAVGSLLYLVFYALHTGLLMLMSAAGFAWWAVIPLIVLYVLGHIGVNILRDSVRSF